MRRQWYLSHDKVRKLFIHYEYEKTRIPLYITMGLYLVRKWSRFITSVFPAG